MKRAQKGHLDSRGQGASGVGHLLLHHRVLRDLRFNGGEQQNQCKKSPCRLPGLVCPYMCVCVCVCVSVHGNVIISVFENTVTRIIMFDY